MPNGFVGHILKPVLKEMRARLSVAVLVAVLAAACAANAGVRAPARSTPTVAATPAPVSPPPTTPAPASHSIGVYAADPTDDIAAPTSYPQPRFDAPPTAPPTTSPATAGRPLSIDLYRAGAFAAQATTSYCVPAAIEVMQNLIGGSPFDTSRATQDHLYALVRSYLIAPWFGRPGAQPEGWAEALDTDGYGPYSVGIRTAKSAAIDLAARDLWLTRRPVGLLVWDGFHAWVMSGFTSIDDPSQPDFQVTGLYVEDPWWPRPNTSWGPSPRPDTLLSIGTFNTYFLPYHQLGEGGLDKNGKFVVIVPTR